MTKQAELEALDRFTASLPADSYLRPWLESIRPEVEHDIRCDFPIAASVKETRRQCEVMLTEARQQAAAITRQAHHEAQQIRTGAARSRDELIAQLRNAINFLCA